MKKKKRNKKCIHDKGFQITVFPWGHCLNCQKPVAEIIKTLLQDCYKHVPVELKDRIFALTKEAR